MIANHQRLPVWEPSADALPALVLGLTPPDIEVRLDLSPLREWRYIQHQTGGHCCNQRALYATRLAWRDRCISPAIEIARRWLDSQAGCWRDDLDEVIAYREQLRATLGVDCRHSFKWFEEAYYPVDASVDAIRLLSVDEVPDRLDDLLVGATFRGRTYDWPPASGYTGGWQLVALAENSD